MSHSFCADLSRADQLKRNIDIIFVHLVEPVALFLISHFLAAKKNFSEKSSTLFC
jgi:hypothetical protein